MSEVSPRGGNLETSKSFLFLMSFIRQIAGIAIALESGIIFPAEFPWNNFEDFSTQLKDRVSRRTGGGALLSDDDKHKTKLSTFKPKALRNPNTYKNLQPDSKEKDKKG